MVPFKGLRTCFLAPVFLLFGVLAGFQAEAQRKYIVYLDGKPDPQFTLANPSAYLGPRSLARRTRNGIPIKFRDLPVSPSYIAQIKARGVNVLYASKWLNAILIETDSASAEQLSTLSFVKGNARKLTNAPFNSQENEYSNICAAPAAAMGPRATLESTDGQNAMLGMDAMQAAGNFGQGALVAVLDAGFPEVNTASPFQALRDSGRIKYTYDFVDHTEDVYGDHWHGTAVLSVMGATQAGIFTGGAPKADYVLLRTEDATPEAVDECFYWVMGAEKADSLGADVINSSLGYTRFDNPELNFSIQDLDGHKLFISRGAEQAADCGIVVVIAAGNEGQNPLWSGKISAPSDADSVLCIGAVFSDTVLAPFSSVGPSADRRIKPEVVAQGVDCALYDARVSMLSAANGTSFASPLVASLAAGLVAKFPDATAMQIRSAIIRSASQFTTPDTLFGHGVPNYRRASLLLTENRPRQSQSLVIYPNPVREGAQFKATTLDMNLLTDLVIYDNLGRTLGTQQANNGLFRAPDVPGVYRLFFSGNSRYTVQTLVVEP